MPKLGEIVKGRVIYHSNGNSVEVVRANVRRFTI